MLDASMLDVSVSHVWLPVVCLRCVREGGVVSGYLTFETILVHATDLKCPITHTPPTLSHESGAEHGDVEPGADGWLSFWL